MSSIGFRNRDNNGLRFLQDNSVGSSTDRYNMWSEARQRSQARRNAPVSTQERLTPAGYSFGGEGSYSVGTPTEDSFKNPERDEYNRSINDDYSQMFGNLDQNIDVDNTTSVDLGNENEFGAGSNIGNNYSITFANQGDNNPYESLQMATRANALNDNFKERSNSNVGGTGRSQQAINQGEKQTGARKIVENLYNQVGEAQAYYQDSAVKYRNRAFGDTGQTPIWKAPKPPQYDD